MNNYHELSDYQIKNYLSIYLVSFYFIYSSTVFLQYKRVHNPKYTKIITCTSLWTFLVFHVFFFLFSCHISFVIFVI